MNTNTVISLPVSADLSAYSHVAVKLTSTGVALATSVNDKVIGQMIRGNSAAANVGDTVIGRACSVFLTAGNGLYFVTLGAGVTTAIAMGDELELDTTDGTYCLRTTGALAGIAVGAAPSSSAGGIIEAILFPQVSPAANPSVTLTTGATLTVNQGGTTFFLAAAGGGAIVLPAATAGLTLTFIIKTAPTTDWTLTSAVADTIVGYPVAALGSDETANGNAAGDVFNFKANVSLPSDKAVFVSDGTSWQVTAVGKATGWATITG